MAEEAIATPVAVPLEWLPWHDGARARLETALTGARLPHGLLLHGPDGLGKERFATVLAAGLLCTGRRQGLSPCGACPDCALSRAASHPDLHWLRRPEDKKSIGVDAVREACEALGMTSMRGGYRVAIVSPAHLMTANAQNALLKTLEEPAPRTLLVLVTSRPSGLAATLRSRCQRVEVSRPPLEQASAWLQEQLGVAASPRLLELTGGAPLKALALAPHFAALEEQMTAMLGALLADRAEATRIAADMLGEGLPARMDWLEAWLGQAVRAQALPDGTRLTVPGGPLLQRAAAEVNITAAFRMLDRVRESRRLLEGSAAPQLVVEALLIELMAAIRRKGVA
ncbi:MAG: DNA polymerase III subunit delta' [Steroidobacteraceae bacterium]|nr:DNA polymerase III subunit delta' [Steroidobacteraceae bacterium]